MKKIAKILVAVVCLIGIVAMLSMETATGDVNAWSCITAAMSLAVAYMLCDKYIWDKDK